MNVSERHHHSLFVEQGAQALLTNIFINGVIAWWSLSAASLEGADVSP